MQSRRARTRDASDALSRFEVPHPSLDVTVKPLGIFLCSLRSDDVLYPSLSVSPEHVLFEPRDRPAQDSAYNAEKRCDELPKHDSNRAQPEPRENEFHKLARLVQIVLARDVVF